MICKTTEMADTGRFTWMTKPTRNGQYIDEYHEPDIMAIRAAYEFGNEGKATEIMESFIDWNSYCTWCRANDYTVGNAYSMYKYIKCNGLLEEYRQFYYEWLEGGYN